ncbi:MAG: type II toxin-antitoxin system VapC family toxin [Gaiellaceae bacterium]
MSSAATASEPVYADASALVKAVVEEPESAALVAYLRASSRQLVSTKIALVETQRAVRIATGVLTAEDAVVDLLAPFVLVAVTDAVLERARRVEPAVLRTLDAIHLATALEVGARTMLVYDRRLAAAATAAGIAVISPR